MRYKIVCFVVITFALALGRGFNVEAKETTYVISSMNRGSYEEKIEYNGKGLMSSLESDKYKYYSSGIIKTINNEYRYKLKDGKIAKRTDTINNTITTYTYYWDGNVCTKMEYKTKKDDILILKGYTKFTYDDQDRIKSKIHYYRSLEYADEIKTKTQYWYDSFGSIKRVRDKFYDFSKDVYNITSDTKIKNKYNNGKLVKASYEDGRIYKYKYKKISVNKDELAMIEQQQHVILNYFRFGKGPYLF